MNSAVSHISFLLVAAVFPVKSCISAQSSGSCFLNESKCCSISGFVGARIRIFWSGNFLNRSIVAIRAISVFPVPVGRMTRQSEFLAVWKIEAWYSLGVIFSSCIVGEEIVGLYY